MGDGAHSGVLPLLDVDPERVEEALGTPVKANNLTTLCRERERHAFLHPIRPVGAQVAYQRERFHHRCEEVIADVAFDGDEMLVLAQTDLDMQ